MTLGDRRWSFCLGLFAISSALAPSSLQDVPPPPPAPPVAQDTASLAEVRAAAGLKAFDMAWLYYSENRVDSEKVYRWSLRLLEAKRQLAREKAGQVEACQDHLDRIKRLEFKIRRIRKIGFGDSLDVVEVDYYRKEAESWLSQAQALVR